MYSLRCEMPARCVVYGCSNRPDVVNQIALHPIPYYGDMRPEAVRRRKRWIDFVKLKRAGWEPSRESHVCSKHFKADDFMRTLNLPGLDERTYPRLKRDDLGITAYPTVQSAIEKQVNLSARTARAIRRKVRRQCFMVFIFYGISIIKYKSNSVIFRVEYFIFPFRPLWEKAHPQLVQNNNRQFLLNTKK